jgi:hypothetical protein
MQRYGAWINTSKWRISDTADMAFLIPGGDIFLVRLVNDISDMVNQMKPPPAKIGI